VNEEDGLFAVVRDTVAPASSRSSAELPLAKFDVLDLSVARARERYRLFARERVVGNRQAGSKRVFG